MDATVKQSTGMQGSDSLSVKLRGKKIKHTHTHTHTHTHREPLDKPDPPRNPTEKMLMMGKVVRRDP